MLKISTVEDEAMTDYTARAVERQLRAMQCRRYRLMTRNEETCFCEWRGPWTAAEVLKAVPWMKHENMDGCHVYIEPDPEEDRALVLVDDLDGASVDELVEHGYAPAAIVETSWKNNQVWIDFGPEPMPPAERRMLAKMLAQAVGGDPCSAGAVHLGRLAGFTNRKYEHLGEGNNGGFPFVTCSMDSRPRIAPRAAEARAWAKMQAEKEAEERGGRLNLAPVRIVRDGLPDIAERVARGVAEYAAWAGSRGVKPDFSKRDFGLVRRLMDEGYADADIVKAMRPVVEAECAQRLRRRKSRSYLDYTVRAVERAAFRDAGTETPNSH
ncbi:MAG: RepB family DNA primase [Desulfovibrio sp.]|nr:RepB family DNA primase [Desulfovibrio sp.]